jgi:bleomycin hydrolase
MKTKTFITVILLFANSLLYCQNKPMNIQGAWLGSVSANNFSLRVIFRFEIKNGNIKGFIDSPDQGMKDLRPDKVWIKNDSIFIDATRSMNAGIIFQGRIMPGDSVIDGVWGGAMPLKLRPTNYVFTLKTNLNPKVDGYKIISLIKSTPIKDQQLTGDCWSYATTSFIETEAMRIGKDSVVLSPMFFVAPTYIDKAEKYIRMNGKSTFTEGDLTFSVMKAYKKYGAIPESVYSGKIDPASKHDHGEMNDSLFEKVKYYVSSGRGTMTIEGCRKDMERILSNTMGKVPETFIYKQKQYTPKSFANEMIGINPNDYIEITSFSHHPFYSKFILEIESNWNNNYYLNLPINDFIKVIDNALLHNYSVCWDGDIYDGVSDGFAVLSNNYKSVTQQTRQEAFDNQTTQDVHNMHIIGIAEDNKGNRFYIVKNSSDIKNCGGYLYMSKEYLMQKTISVLVNRNAIPKEIVKETWVNRNASNN